MKRVGIVGTDWRRAGPEGIATYTLPADRREEGLAALGEIVGAAELIYLATCNRAEVIFVGDGETPIATYRRRVFEALRGRPAAAREAETELRAWGGEGAAEHLFMLASGLESAMLGEREIVGQMRDSVDASRRLGLGGPILEWLFEEAFKVGRRVHRFTGLGGGKVSLAELALVHVRERLAKAPGTVALIGVSPMTLRCARALSEAGTATIIYNRTAARARSAADELGLEGRALDDLTSDPPIELAAVVSATGAADPVLGRAALERLATNPSGHSPLIVDLAIPPDVDPEDARLVDLQRIGMEEILAEAETHRRGREEAAEAGRRIVDDALVDLEAKLIAGSLDPVFAALQRRYRLTAERGVDRLISSELAGLSPESEAEVRRWAAVLARRLAHVPTAGLRAVARNHGLEAVESFLSEADVDLAKELAKARADASRPAPQGLRAEVDGTPGKVLG